MTDEKVDKKVAAAAISIGVIAGLAIGAGITGVADLRVGIVAGMLFGGLFVFLMWQVLTMQAPDRKKPEATASDEKPGVAFSDEQRKAAWNPSNIQDKDPKNQRPLISAFETGTEEQNSWPPPL